MSRIFKSNSTKKNSKKAVIYLFVGVLLLLGLFVAGVFPSAGVPNLKVSVEQLDLGKGSPNEVVRGVLQLRNTGTAQLEFSIERSCTCTELNPANGVIAPGGVQEITLGVKLPGHANSERSVGITVSSNDPIQPIIRCRAVARCPALLEVNPSFISFGKVYDKEFASKGQQVSIKSVEGGERMTSDGLLVSQEGDFFHVGKQDESNGTVLLRLFLKRGLGYGEYYGLLKLQMDGAKYGLTVPVSADIVEPVSVIPSTIYVRKDWRWYESHPITVLFRSSKQDLLISELRLDSPPPGINIDEVTELQPGLKRVQLKVSREAISEHKTILNFFCDGVDEELTLTLLSSEQSVMP